MLKGVSVARRKRLKPAEVTTSRIRVAKCLGQRRNAGSPQFTHISLDDFPVIRDNLAGGNRTTRDRIVPSCLFTDPQVAHVGLTETEAKRCGIKVRAAKMAVVEMAMLAGLPRTALSNAILTHPTMAEGLNVLFPRVEQPGEGAVSLRQNPAKLSQDNGSTRPGRIHPSTAAS